MRSLGATRKPSEDFIKCLLCLRPLKVTTYGMSLRDFWLLKIPKTRIYASAFEAAGF